MEFIIDELFFEFPAHAHYRRCARRLSGCEAMQRRFDPEIENSSQVRSPDKIHVTNSLIPRMIRT